MKYKVEELHHEQLRHWVRYSRRCPAPPDVLTLDYHTDTLSSLRRGVNPPGPEDPETAIAQLRHDEHFDWAIRHKVIGGAVILAHVPDPEPKDNPRVVCDRSWPDMEILLNSPEQYRILADRVIESDFLAARLSEAGFDWENARGFILDLDLDYFLTEKSFHPDDGTLFEDLKARAGLITVSRERDWVRLLRIP